MKTSQKIGAVVLAMILVGGLGLLISTSDQTVLSVSQMKVDGDKNYWVVNAIADSLDERATFISRLPSQGKLADGTTITPKDALQITISEGDESCEYLANRQTRVIDGPLFNNPTVVFYTLSSPERVVNFKVSDDRGNSHIFDGTTQQTETFIDIDGKGEVVVQSVGTLSTKSDCPAGTNVIVLKASENTWVETDKAIEYLDRSDFTTSIENGIGWFDGFEVLDSYAFIRDFANGGLDFDGNKVVGTGRDIGRAQLVLSADADYFNSIVVTPAKPAVPKIIAINLPDEAQRNSVGSMSIQIENEASDAGKALISITSNDASFTPSADDFTIVKSRTFYRN